MDTFQNLLFEHTVQLVCRGSLVFVRFIYEQSKEAVNYHYDDSRLNTLFDYLAVNRFFYPDVN